jgi:RecB family exonuclease
MASRSLIVFVRDLTRCAASGTESDVRRALCSPYSGVPNVDARALTVVAGDRRDVRDAIEAERVPLGRESALAARRFAKALDALNDAFRAQGATVREHLATIWKHFEFVTMLSASERDVWIELERIASTLDVARPAGAAWEPAAFLEALDRFARDESMLSAVREPAATLRPLALHPPETPRIVRRRHGHFSASSLGSFAECERRWFYRYVCSAVEDRGSSASFYGSAFHWALERFHEEFPRADSAPPDLLERKLDALLGASFDRYRSGFATNVEYELQRRRAKRTGRRYLAWFLERGRQHPFTVVGTETAVELELGGYHFVGYIDRLDRDDATNAVTVVDYKTGTIAESAEEYRGKVARFLDFQLPFYYWARTAAGDRVTRLSLVPLKDALRDVRPVELEVVPIAAPRSYGDALTGTIGIDELERARAKMIELAATLASGPIEHFAVTTDPDACTYCAYVDACRDRPLLREDRFGR